MKKEFCQQDKVLAIIILIITCVFFVISPLVRNNANTIVYETNDRILNSLSGYTSSYNLAMKASEASTRIYLNYLRNKGVIKTIDENTVAQALLDNAKDLNADEKKVFYENVIGDGIGNDVFRHCNYYVKGIHYANEEGFVFSNSKELKKIQKSKDKNYDDVMKSSWLYVVNINEKGKQKVTHSNIEKLAIDNLLFREVQERANSLFLDENGNSTLQWKAITDISTFVIEIPARFLFTQKIVVNDIPIISNTAIYRQKFIKEYGVFALIVFVMAFLLPSKKMMKSKLLSFTSRSKMCIFILLIQVITFFIMAGMGASMLSYIRVSTVLMALLVFIIMYLALIPSALFAIAMKKWYVKLMHKEEKEESLLYSKVLNSACWVKRKCNALIQIDFTEKSYKKIMMFTVLNCLFIFTMFVLYTKTYYNTSETLLLLLAYGVVFYLVLRKSSQSMKKDYKVLDEVVKDMGHVEEKKEIKQNLGVFEPMKDSLQNLQSDFKEAIDQELQSQHMKTELITNVSHDLKTPLTSIISYIDLLENDKLTKKERAKYIEVLASSSNRLKQLIDNLFEISKANSGNVSLELMDVDIISLLKQAEVECESTLKTKQLQIRNQFAEKKILLSLDSQKTYRIFENLLSNVGKYALANTRVYVKVEDYANMVEISIKNVSAQELDFDPDEIMERFTRGDKSRNSEGSGLGLAIAKSFSELQNGLLRISIEGDLFKVSVRFYRKRQESQ